MNCLCGNKLQEGAPRCSKCASPMCTACAAASAKQPPGLKTLGPECNPALLDIAAEASAANDPREYLPG